MTLKEVPQRWAGSARPTETQINTSWHCAPGHDTPRPFSFVGWRFWELVTAFSLTRFSSVDGMTRSGWSLTYIAMPYWWRSALAAENSLRTNWKWGITLAKLILTQVKTWKKKETSVLPSWLWAIFKARRGESPYAVYFIHLWTDSKGFLFCFDFCSVLFYFVLCRDFIYSRLASNSFCRHELLILLTPLPGLGW